MMVNAKFIGNRMWTFWPEVDITNKSGFCALPVGYAVERGAEDNQRFQGMNNYAVFWTSDSDGDYGLYRYIYVQQNDVMLAKGDKTSFRASVRCIKD